MLVLSGRFFTEIYHMILFIEDDPITQFIYEDWFGNDSKFIFSNSLSESKQYLAKGNIKCVVADIHLTDGLIFELHDVFVENKLPVALAFGSNLRSGEQQQLENFPFAIKFKKPLDKTVLQDWFTSLGV